MSVACGIHHLSVVECTVLCHLLHTTPCWRLLQVVTAQQPAGSRQQVVVAATAAAGQARPPGPALQQEGQEGGATGVQTATSSPSTAVTRQPRRWQTGLPAAPCPQRRTRPTQRRWAPTQLPLPGRLMAAGVVGRLCLALCLPQALLLPPPTSTGVGWCLVGATLWQLSPLLAAGASQCTGQAQGGRTASCQLV